MRRKTLIQCFAPVLLMVLALGGAQARNGLADKGAAPAATEKAQNAKQKNAVAADSHEKIDPSQYVAQIRARRAMKM